MLSDHISQTDRRRVTILTVDPPSRRIEATGKGNIVFQITVHSTPTFFRWPVEGEDWVIERINGYWQLDSIYQSPDDSHHIEDLLPGDVLINSGSGRVLITEGGSALVGPNLAAAGKYAVTIGDAASFTFTITHNLGTTDVIVNVYDMATGNFELVGYNVVTVNTISVGAFGVAPAAASGTIGSGTGKRIVVIG